MSELPFNNICRRRLGCCEQPAVNAPVCTLGHMRVSVSLACPPRRGIAELRGNVTADVPAHSRAIFRSDCALPHHQGHRVLVSPSSQQPPLSILYSRRPSARWHLSMVSICFSPLRRVLSSLARCPLAIRIFRKMRIHVSCL